MIEDTPLLNTTKPTAYNKKQPFYIFFFSFLFIFHFIHRYHRTSEARVGVGNQLNREDYDDASDKGWQYDNENVEGQDYNRAHIIPASWIPDIYNNLRHTGRRLQFCALLGIEVPSEATDRDIYWAEGNYRFGNKFQNKKIGNHLDLVVTRKADGKLTLDSVTRRWIIFLTDPQNWPDSGPIDFQGMAPIEVNGLIQSSGQVVRTDQADARGRHMFGIMEFWFWDLDDESQALLRALFPNNPSWRHRPSRRPVGAQYTLSPMFKPQSGSGGSSQAGSSSQHSSSRSPPLRGGRHSPQHGEDSTQKIRSGYASRDTLTPAFKSRSPISGPKSAPAPSPPLKSRSPPLSSGSPSKLVRQHSDPGGKSSPGSSPDKQSSSSQRHRGAGMPPFALKESSPSSSGTGSQSASRRNRGGSPQDTSQAGGSSLLSGSSILPQENPTLSSRFKKPDPKMQKAATQVQVHPVQKPIIPYNMVEFIYNNLKHRGKKSDFAFALGVKKPMSVTEDELRDAPNNNRLADPRINTENRFDPVVIPISGSDSGLTFDKKTLQILEFITAEFNWKENTIPIEDFKEMMPTYNDGVILCSGEWNGSYFGVQSFNVQNLAPSSRELLSKLFPLADWV